MMNYILAFLIVGGFWSVVGFVAYKLRKNDKYSDPIFLYIATAFCWVLLCLLFISGTILAFLSLAGSIK